MYENCTTRRMNPMLGSFVTMSTVESYHAANPVADAFTTLRYLVVLHYAQRRLVVSVKNTEANSEKDAIAISLRRARNAFDDLGNVLSSDCLPDTPENRKTLRLTGDYEECVSYMPRWQNAA